MHNWRENRIASAINGTNPMVMAELPGGFAVLVIPSFYLDIQYCCPKGKWHL